MPSQSASPAPFIADWKASFCADATQPRSGAFPILTGNDAS